MTGKSYQASVIKEADDLRYKTDKLRTFIFYGDTHFWYNEDITESEKIRLITQLYIMEQYSAILNERIRNFK